MADTIQSSDLDQNKKPQGSTISQPPGQPGVPAGQNQSGSQPSQTGQPGVPTAQTRQIGTQQTQGGPQQQGTGYTK